MAGKKLAAEWRNRIIGEGVERPDQLLANPSNWRIHPKHQQDALSAVLDNVGWVQRVIINRTTGHIVDGHLRVSLAISRNETEVPVVYVDLTEDEELTVLATIDPLSAMAATDSAKLAELLASVQTDDAALEAVLRGVGETAGLDMGGVIVDAPEVDVDRAEELRIKWGVEYGDLWRVPSKHGGEHRILCGDSTNAADVARVMGGAKANAVVTDPPYGINHKGIANDDPEGLRGLFDAVLTAAPITDAVVIAFQSPRLFPVWIDAIRSAGQEVERALWMYKPNATNTFPWRGWLMTGEIIIVSVLGDGKWAKPADYMHDTYSIQSGAQTDMNGLHTTPKPPEVVRHLIDNTIGNVYDPFLGSGTTAVACEQLARVCYAVEISPAYVAVALERLSLMGLTPEREAADG